MIPDAPNVVGAEYLHGLARELAVEGVRTDVGRQRTFLEALAAAPPERLNGLYWRARTTLLDDVRQFEPFNRAFRRWATGLERDADRVPWATERDGQQELTRDDDQGAPPQRPRGTQSSADFGEGGRGLEGADDELLQELAELDRTLARVLPRMPSRRSRTASRGRRLDVRRVARDAARAEDTATDLHWRTPRTRPRRVVLVVDVSGSQAAWWPDMLRFAHRVVRANPRSEVYTAANVLTRITPGLRTTDCERAVRQVVAGLRDADGGTRIGPALWRLVSRPEMAGHCSGALVLMLSDGLERGDQELAIRSVRRLATLSHRLVWWSPLALDPRFRPESRLFAAVLPALDELAGAADLASLRQASERLPEIDRGPRGGALRAWRSDTYEEAA